MNADVIVALEMRSNLINRDIILLTIVVLYQVNKPFKLFYSLYCKQYQAKNAYLLVFWLGL